MRDFQHAVNVLVKAYFKGTLKKGRCEACAVGNIICAAGIDLVDISEQNVSGEIPKETQWLLYLQREHRGINNPVDLSEALRQIESTGYNSFELHLIEKAFEAQENEVFDAGYQVDYDATQFKSLMAVVDILADIHGIDLKAKEEAKALFVKSEN